MNQGRGKRKVGMWAGIVAVWLGTAGCGVTASGSANVQGAAAGAGLASNTATRQSGAANADLASWAGKGNVALLYDQTESLSATGGKLYTVIGDSASQSPRKYFLATHVLSARFSPDGKWLAVITQDSSTSSGNGKSNSAAQPVETLWLISADGSQKQKIISGEFLPGTWVANGTYLYGTNPVYSVQPGNKPTRLSIQLPKDATIGQYGANTKLDKVAIVITQPTPGKDVTERFDSMDVLNPATGAVHVLKKGQPSDGFVLGPWLNDNKFFYWPDPMHSASLLADGAELSSISTDGSTQKVTTTLVGPEYVATNGSDKAAIQVGAGRTLFISKAIGVWDGKALEILPHADNGVAIWPTVDGSGKRIAFTEGPELSASATAAQTQDWWQKLQLATYDEGTHGANVLAAAGNGVIEPHFDQAGDAIVYLEDNSLNWIRSDGAGIAHKVVTFPGTSWKSYPQQMSAASSSLVIADYHPWN